MNNILIIGASGHAKVVADIVELEGKYRIVGLIGHNLANTSYKNGYQIIGTLEELPKLVRDYAVHGIIAGVGDNFARSKVATLATELCPQLVHVSAIHPAATVARSAVIGDGTAIMAGAIVNSCCTIGRGCILNTGSSLDHDSVLKDYASLAPGVHVGGNCVIGEVTAVCIGASVRHNITIGAHSVVGAGSVVLHDVAANTVAYGTPARAIRTRNAGDRYL